MSAETYNKLAQYYRKCSVEKRNYISSIDSIILERIVGKHSLLDLGTGDGIRAVELSKKTGIRDLTLVDNSFEMIKLCKLIGTGEIIYSPIEDYVAERQFDVITCLWNVLGHIEPYRHLTRVFQNIKKMLKRDGMFFIDVNNRYNVSCYGPKMVSRNIMADFFGGKLDKEYVEFTKRICSVSIPMRVHFFTFTEIEKLVCEANLKIAKCYFIDYDSGAVKKYAWQGQLFFEIVH